MSQQMLARLGAIAFIVGAVIAAIKTDRFNTIVAKFGLKPVPKTMLPWLSLVLGLVLATIDARMQGQSWIDACVQGLMGLVSGATAIAGNEAVIETTKQLIGRGRYTPHANDNSDHVDSKTPTEPPKAA